MVLNNNKNHTHHKHEYYQMEHEQSHESSNHFCFSSDEIGNLTRECIINRLAVMTQNDNNLYSYERFLPDRDRQRMQSNPMLIVDPDWRASIVKWTYNVVDHFDLNREVVAISMAIFDRFFATGIVRPSSDLILLVSIATLHIAIKLRESAIITLGTLSWFGRGRFSETRITNAELQILSSLRWMVNPPTTISYVMHLLVLLPDSFPKRELLESTRFMAELSVADSFFIAKRSSIVALAAIMNSLDEFSTSIDPTSRGQYMREVTSVLGISHDDNTVASARRRLRLLSLVNGNGD